MSEAANITVRVPFTIRQRPGRETVVAPEAADWLPQEHQDVMHLDASVAPSIKPVSSQDGLRNPLWLLLQVPCRGLHFASSDLLAPT